MVIFGVTLVCALRNLKCSSIGWLEKPVHIHDLHATILHLLGLDHTRLTYRYSGRDFRLTDVAGEVIKDIVS